MRTPAYSIDHFSKNLPQFETNEELNQFLREGFVPQLSRSFYPQLLLTTIILIIIVLLGALTTVSRLIKKTFWVFKIQEFPSGKVLVFNTTNIFTICQLVFIASLQAMVWVIREQSDQGGNLISSKRFMYSLLLPWIPLVTGAYLSVQGTFVACHQIINEQSIMPSSFIVNGLTLILPLTVSSFAVPLAVVSGNRYADSFEHFKSLSQTLLASPTSRPTEASREAAVLIWYSFTKSWRILCIGFLFWALTAVFFSLLVIVFGYFLIRSLYSHLREARNNGNNTYITTQTITTYFPARSVPQNATEHSKGGKMSSRQKRVVLSSAIQLILWLGVGITLGSLGCLAISAYIASNCYELASTTPRLAQVAVSRLLLSIMWLVVLCGTFTFTLISISAFNAILENYSIKRSSRKRSRVSRIIRTLIEMLPQRLRNEILKHQEDAEGTSGEDDSDGTRRGSSSNKTSSVALPRIGRRTNPAVTSNLVPSFVQEEDEEGQGGEEGVESQSFWPQKAASNEQDDEGEGDFDGRSAGKYSRTKSNASSNILHDQLSVNTGGEDGDSHSATSRDREGEEE